jgi:HSP20 family protein
MARKNEQKKGPDSPIPAGFGIGGIFDGIQKLLDAAAKLKDAEQHSQTGEFSIPGLGEKGKGIFGFSIRTMAGGDSHGVKVQPFGNMHKTKDGMTVEEDREPVVDVLEEADRFRVIAELPGVSESNITYELVGDVLTITAKGDRRYHAEVLLPGPAVMEGIQSSYNNGVLELKLRRK